MRNMSFSLTEPQLISGQKTVTRRLGWKFLKVGDVVMACRKCMGLKKGEKIHRLGPIRIVSVRREPLFHMLDSDCALEGFPEMSPIDFIEMAGRELHVSKYQMLTRIEFERLP